MIYLATGLTPNFLPIGAGLYEDLRTKCNVRPLLFLVNFQNTPPLLDWCEVVHVDYSKAKVQLPKWMLQHGGFMEFREFNPSDVVIFTDGDARLQRPFDEQELELLQSVRLGEVFIGRKDRKSVV